jgi:hypothetical protein
MNQPNNRLAGYVEVNERIMKFYEKFPDGSIQTELISWQDGKVIVKAFAYRTADDVRPGTGHAYEMEGSSQVNRTSALENCETSAVGRALALLGFEIKKSVASKEEVTNAIHQQESPPDKPTADEVKVQAQKKAITAAIRKVGMAKEEFNEILCGLDIASYADINADQAQKILSTLATYKPKEAVN